MKPKLTDREILEGVDYYDKLPVIYWKEILQENPKNHYNRRPARMHRTLNLHAALWWIEKLLGIPMDRIQFTGVKDEDLYTTIAADLQD
jgi:hypothetical protein